MNVATNECPKCQNLYLVADYLKCDESSVWRTITCPECGFMWNEVYEFSHNEDIVTTARLEF